MRRIVAAGLAITGMIAGVAAGPATRDGAPPAAPDIAWAACPADVPSEGLRCGTVETPLDHARPDGPTTTLALSLAPATGTRLGTIMVNPGGPGGGGMWLPALLRNRFPAQVRERYDIVGVDPRGNHHSDPVSCGAPEAVPRPDPVPATAADEDRLIARARGYARACAEHAGDLLAHLGTDENARDLDVVRAALGQERISFVGWSYGTYLGAVYGELFPRRVDKMILDSVVDPRPAQVWYGANLRQNVAFQERWQDFVAATGPDIDDLLATTLARLRAHPHDGVFGPAELYDTLTRAMYSSAAWPELARALRADDGDALAASYTPPTAREANEYAVYTAVECHDGPWPRDWRTWHRDAQALHVDNPLLTWSNTWFNAPCAFWPVPPRRPPTIDGDGLPPVLLVQGTRDPATPPDGAAAMHAALARSHRITVTDEGDHGILAFQDNPCVLGIAAAYLIDGTLPAGRESTCEAQ